MKRYSNLYDNMINIKNINKVYNTQIKVNTKNKFKIYRFEEYYTLNICDINKLLESNNYEVGKYNIFLIKDPKYRIIMSQNIKDKLINHLVGNELINILDKSLINTNVATRKGKGTHYGIKFFKRYLNDLKGKEVYALKFDVSKYFYNIDHNILKGLYYSKIKDKRFLVLLDKIIDSTNSFYVNEKIHTIVFNEMEKVKKSDVSKNKKYKKINELKSIPLYKNGKGLPIGNLTSQILAVFYLNELDHFILEELKVKYIRYMDDGILLSNDKEYLKYCLNEIDKIITKYKLSLNNKTNIVKITKNGIDFLGFIFYIKNNKVIMKVRNRTKRNFKRKIKLIKNNKLKNAKGIIASYNGHFKCGNCFNLFNNYLTFI